MNLPSVDEIKGIWARQHGDARIAWGKLMEDAFLNPADLELKVGRFGSRDAAPSRATALTGGSSSAFSKQVLK